ncbi:MAG: TVP38/TMEM64 family protein [Rhodoplanes sp.]
MGNACAARGGRVRKRARLCDGPASRIIACDVDPPPRSDQRLCRRASVGGIPGLRRPLCRRRRAVGSRRGAAHGVGRPSVWSARRRSRRLHRGDDGSLLIFFIGRSALGGWLVKRAGPFAEKLADGFRRGAFSYLLFLRLVPLFPFWLVNIAPALFGVRFAVFVGATALGIIPLTFAFALFGAGLDSAIAAQASAYQACLAAGHEPCRIDFDLRLALTPELIAALAAVGVVALVPLAVKRWRAARGRNVA